MNANDEVFDIVLQMHDAYEDETIRKSFHQCPPVQGTFCLGKDLAVGYFGEEDLGCPIMQIVEACFPRGYSKKTKSHLSSYMRHDTPVYAFLRRNPPHGDRHWKWDEDNRLQLSIALSRLCHPTSMGFNFSARVFRNPAIAAITAIEPGWDAGFGSIAYVLDLSRYWLTVDDCGKLKNIIEKYDEREIGPRLKRSLWLHEYAARTGDVQIRCSLIAAALESIINTDERDNKRQFVRRVTELSIKAGLSCSESIARDFYSIRSNTVHGQALQGSSAGLLEILATIESTLQRTIAEGIVDREFGDFLENPFVMRKRWPVR